VTAWLEHAVDVLGYGGIFLLLALSRAIPPVPAEVIVPLGGLAAADGRLNFALVVLSSGLGSAAGEFLWYLPSRRLGRARLLRFLRGYGHWLTLTPEQVDRATDWFERRGGLAVALCQPIPGLRTLVAVPAGALGQSPLRFLALASLGSTLFVLVLAALGYFLGTEWRAAARYLGWFSLVLFGLVLLVYFYRLARQLRARARRGEAAP
jgi:membrane protein DedA with SNARE-associated domain